MLRRIMVYLTNFFTLFKIYRSIALSAFALETAQLPIRPCLPQDAAADYGVSDKFFHFVQNLSIHHKKTSRLGGWEILFFFF